MTSQEVFDIAVIGRGMIGAAAARHAAEAGASVVLVGGGEPADYGTPDAGPFASHYDEARITRISATDEVWADVATRSIGRYGDIAKRSGIDFHQATGLITASSDAQRAVRIATARGAEVKHVDVDWVRSTTGINIDLAGMSLFYEAAPAGVIRPRLLVEAQVTLADRAGASLVDRPADSVLAVPQGVAISTSRGTVVAQQVVIATGAYGIAGLLGIRLAIERRLRTVAHIEIEARHELPALIVERPGQPSLDRLYWTPPVRYLDGRFRLKVGASIVPLETAEHDADIARWFSAGGSTTEAAALVQSVRSLLPDATIIDSYHQPCVMAYTKGERPFVGRVDEHVVVALGGNGAGAKGSDELGRLAALAATGQSDPLLDSLVPQLT